MDDVHIRIAAQADRNRDSIVDFLCRLIRAQRSGETVVQNIVATAARGVGCAVEAITYRPRDVPMIEEFAGDSAIDAGERASLIARYRGTGVGRSVIFFAHPDSEPVANVDRWRHDPFAGAIENGKIYGWGVADDLAGIATLVEGLRLALAAGVTPLGDVILASAPSKRHARGVSALLHRGLDADAAVYLHPAESGVGMREIKAFASGQLEFSIVIDGKAPETNEPSHTAFAHRAVNPVDKAWIIYRALQALGERRAEYVRHPLLQEAVGRSTNLLLSYIAAGVAACPSRVAPSCVIGGALSFPPVEKLTSVQAEIEKTVWKAADADEWLRTHPPRIMWDSGVAGAEVKTDHPLYQTVARAVLAFTGYPPHVNPMHTSSDIRNPIVQKGIPTVGLGPLAGDLTQNGRTDEWVDVEDYLRAVKVAAGIIARWCGAQ